jgi:hypothetical protein
MISQRHATFTHVSYPFPHSVSTVLKFFLLFRPISRFAVQYLRYCHIHYKSWNSDGYTSFIMGSGSKTHSRIQWFPDFETKLPELEGEEQSAITRLHGKERASLSLAPA